MCAEDGQVIVWGAERVDDFMDVVGLACSIRGCSEQYAYCDCD